MEAPEEEDSGPFGLGAFLDAVREKLVEVAPVAGHSGTGGAGRTRDFVLDSLYQGGRRNRQLGMRPQLIKRFSQSCPSTIARPTQSRSRPRLLFLLPSPSHPILPPTHLLHTPSPPHGGCSGSQCSCPGFFANADAEMERRLKEAHLQSSDRWKIFSLGTFGTHFNVCGKYRSL